MKLEDLKDDVVSYKRTQEEIKTKRELWHTHTKNLISETLRKITKTYELDWDVLIVESTRNQEGVNLTFGNSFNSIYNLDEAGKRNYAKTGGNLVFTQAYNGDVFIILLSPNINEYESTQDSQKILGKVNPAKIDENLIVHHVSLFLTELAEWENIKSTSVVGFKN
ncbi:MAG: hypothetical protein KC454_04550 [Flavobacteriales bacterium]|nr:hypothetical protein [Flavobacteriales bacterium]